MFTANKRFYESRSKTSAVPTGRLSARCGPAPSQLAVYQVSSAGFAEGAAPLQAVEDLAQAFLQVIEHDPSAKPVRKSLAHTKRWAQRWAPTLIAPVRETRGPAWLSCEPYAVVARCERVGD